MLTTFIKSSSLDSVFQKNLDLLEIIETLLSHHAVERSRDWNLWTSSLKESIHFSMISNCTQYGPLLIELLFRQFTFQERFLELMMDGYFTFQLRDSSKSAFVGYDATIEDVNLLAGQFRHKRQTLEQAIEQSLCIDILQKQLKQLYENIGLKNSHR